MQMSDPSGEDRTGGRGGRPRDITVDQRILQATTSLLAQRGFRGLRVDDVARSAGVPKSTIYRRWPSLTDLAVAVPGVQRRVRTVVARWLKVCMP